MKTRRFSIRDAVADHLGMDFADMPWYRYQSTQTPCAIYQYDMDYYTATSGDRRPPDTDFPSYWHWVEVKDEFAAAKGWHIWKHEPRKTQPE